MGYLEILILVIFLLGYAAITLEHNTKIDKLVPALVMMAAAWAVVSLSHLPVFEITDQGKQATSVNSVLLHHFGKTCEILIFLISLLLHTIAKILEKMPSIMH